MHPSGSLHRHIDAVMHTLVAVIVSVLVMTTVLVTVVMVVMVLYGRASDVGIRCWLRLFGVTLRGAGLVLLLYLLPFQLHELLRLHRSCFLAPFTLLLVAELL